MIWRRYIIIVTVNLGRLAQALQRVGIEVSVPKNRVEFADDFLRVSARMTLDTGEIVSFAVRNLHDVANKIVYEFLSLQGFVDYVTGIVTTTKNAVRSGKLHEIDP